MKDHEIKIPTGESRTELTLKKLIEQLSGDAYEANIGNHLDIAVSCIYAIKLLALEIQGIKDELSGAAKQLPQIWAKELPGDEKRFYTCPRCNNKGKQYLGNVTESTIKRDGYEVFCGQCGRNYVIHFHPPGEQTIEYCQNPDNWNDSFKELNRLYHEAHRDKKLDEIEKLIEELEAKLKNNP